MWQNKLQDVFQCLLWAKFARWRIIPLSELGTWQWKNHGGRMSNGVGHNFIYFVNINCTIELIVYCMECYNHDLFICFMSCHDHVTKLLYMSHHSLWQNWSKLQYLGSRCKNPIRFLNTWSYILFFLDIILLGISDGLNVSGYWLCLTL